MHCTKWGWTCTKSQHYWHVWCLFLASLGYVLINDKYILEKFESFYTYCYLFQFFLRSPDEFFGFSWRKIFAKNRSQSTTTTIQRSCSSERFQSQCNQTIRSIKYHNSILKPRSNEQVRQTLFVHYIE